MGKKRTKKVVVHIPSNLLEELDREISGVYASRNEAIRAGIIMVVEAEKRRCAAK